MRTILIFILAACSTMLAEEEPKVARLMRGDLGMSDQVIKALDSYRLGKVPLKHTSTAYYLDGGSSGARFRLNDKQEMILFSPWWEKSWKDVRLAVAENGKGVPKWSKTLEEDPKLRQKLRETFTILLDREKRPYIRDKQTWHHVRALFDGLDLKSAKEKKDD